MSMDAQSVSEKLRSSGLLRTQGLIGGKWLDSYDNKTIKVISLCFGDVILECFMLTSCFLPDRLTIQQPVKL